LRSHLHTFHASLAFLFVLARPGGDIRSFLLSCAIVDIFFTESMSFSILSFLSLFLPFLLPSLSSPIAPPSVPGSHDQASLGGNFNALSSPIPVVMEATVWADGAWTPSPPSTKPVLFLPQDPSADSFPEPASGSTAHDSVSPELGSVVIQPHMTQGPPSTTGTYLTPLIMGYYPVWRADVLPPENIDFSHVDWIDFAFAMPNEAAGLDWDGSEAPGILMRLVDVAHQHGKKVKLSVGGWGGSRYVGLRRIGPASAL
jgi:hypothetical protein